MLARKYWLLPPPATVFVAVDEEDDTIVGTSFVRPNQPGLGSHVANAAFLVAPKAGGPGCGPCPRRTRDRLGASEELFSYEIQFCRQHQLACDCSVEKSWIQNRRY